MKLFKRKQDHHISNVALEQMEFHDHFDQNVIFIARNEKPEIQGTIHICLTNESLEKEMEELKTQYPKDEITCTQSVLGLAIDYALQQHLVLMMHGFSPMPLMITAQDLEPIRDIVDSFCIMYAYARNRMPLAKAYSLLEKKSFYYIGEPFTVESTTFSVEVMQRSMENQRQYQSVKLFLNEDSANQYNKESHPISVGVLSDLYEMWKGMYGLIIEPHRNFWVEFGVDELK